MSFFKEPHPGLSASPVVGRMHVFWNRMDLEALTDGERNTLRCLL